MAHTDVHAWPVDAQVYKNFKEGKHRILVATDLVGRGIDIERVNIVINYDMPESDDKAKGETKHGNGADTYLHRVSIERCTRTRCGLLRWRHACQCLGGPRMVHGVHRCACDLAAPQNSNAFVALLSLSGGRPYH